MNDTSPVFPKPRLLNLGVSATERTAGSVELSQLSAELLQFLHDNRSHLSRLAVPCLFLSIATILLYRWLYYPVFASPLSNIPCAHRLAAITPLWMDWRRLTGREVETTWAAFNKYGPYVRLGPNEIAVNTISGGVTTAHGHGFQNLDKSSWYDFFINHG